MNGWKICQIEDQRLHVLLLTSRKRYQFLDCAFGLERIPGPDVHFGTPLQETLEQDVRIQTSSPSNPVLPFLCLRHICIEIMFTLAISNPIPSKGRGRQFKVKSRLSEFGPGTPDQDGSAIVVAIAEARSNPLRHKIESRGSISYQYSLP